MSCALCDAALGPVLHASVHWRLVLNRNQDLLGKCFLALRRHEESVTDLTGDEWADLHGQLALATEALRDVFLLDHVNYVFLQNQDRHVHLHVVPRYATSRTLGGEVFDDPGYPGHYVVGAEPRLLDTGMQARLASAIIAAVVRRAGGLHAS